MTRRTQPASDSDLLDAAETFRELPLIYSVIAATVVAVLCEIVAPVVVASQATGGRFDYAQLFLPILKVAGGFLAAAILLFGVVGAVSRWFQRRDDRRRLDIQTGIESIRRLSWQEFERLLGEAYKRRGYEVRFRGGPRADGGADLELHRAREKLLVQAKHWRTWRVKLPQVRELWGAVADEHAGKNLTLVDGGT